MGVAVMIDSSVEVLPMQQFMQDLVRGSSHKEKNPQAEGSAKSVLDFDQNTAAVCADGDGSTQGSAHSSIADTFDLNSLVLVSDNARVFAKARPKQSSKEYLTSSSWHSSSELRKMYTANARWGSSHGDYSSNSLSSNNSNSSFGTPSLSSSRNKSFQLDRPPSFTRNTSDGERPAMQRRTSDSCLSVPTRSWMNQQQPRPNHDGPQRPRRSSDIMSSSSKAAALVASRFAADPMETALEARRSWHERTAPQPPRSRSTETTQQQQQQPPRTRPLPPSHTSSEESLFSVNSFESCGSNDELVPLSRLPEHPAARDSKELISCGKSSNANNNNNTPSTNARWSPPTQPNRKRNGRKASTTHSPPPKPARRVNGKPVTKPRSGSESSCSSSVGTVAARNPKEMASPPRNHHRFEPIPPSLLAPYDRFQAEASSTREPKQRGTRRTQSASAATSSIASAKARRNQLAVAEEDQEGRREPRLGTSRSSKLWNRGGSGSGSKLFRRGGSGSGSKIFQRGGSGSGSKLFRRAGNAGNSNHSMNSVGSRGTMMKHQSDHKSPVSILEFALGDMAPKMTTRSGRRTVGRTRSSRY